MFVTGDIHIFAVTKTYYMESGIYKIVNAVTGKLYVGRSKNVFRRFKDHKYELRKNKHGNQYLQNAWNKYGEENFMWEVIELCSLDIISERESYWIKELNTLDRERGYNIEERDLQNRYTEEYKQHLSKLQKENLLAYHQKQKDSGKREVKVYDLITGEYEIFPSTKDCPYSFKKNGHYNFRIGKLKLKADMDDNSIKLIVKEYTLKYQHFLRTQSSETNYQLPKKEIYSHQYSTIWKSDKEILEFTTNVKAAEYFNISLPYVCLIVKKGTYKEFAVEKNHGGGCFLGCVKEWGDDVF